MPRAVLRNGVVVPIEPLPQEWAEGKELVIEEAGHQDNSEDLNKWIQEMEVTASKIDPREWEELQATLDQMRREAKDRVRRQI